MPVENPNHDPDGSAMEPKTFKSFLKLPGGGEIARCYYPFKLDTYGCGCVHDCAYCYAKSVLHFRRLWNAEQPAVAEVARIEKIFADVFDKGKRTKYTALLTDRIPLRLGGMTDCFSPAEAERGVTLAVLKLLRRYDYPCLILTKNRLIAEDRYLRALDPQLAYVQFSVTTPFDDLAAKFEAGASVTSERLAAMRLLADAGFHVAGRVNPLFPRYPDGHYTATGSRKGWGPHFRYFDKSLVGMLAEAGCRTLIAGFLRLSTWNLRWIREKTGEDLSFLFDPAIRQKNTALHFSTEEKRYYYERLRDRCRERGLEFSVCCDGDVAYETPPPPYL